MKLFSKILLVFLIASFFSSCSQRRYGQLTGFQFNKKGKTEKVVKKRSGHYVKFSDEVKNNQTLKTKYVAANKTKETPENIASENVSTSIVLSDSKEFKVNKKKIIKSLLVDKQDAPIKVGINPINKIKKAKSAVDKQKNDGGLLYIILVVILVLLIISLLEKFIGPWLSSILILVLLILLVLHLLGSL